MSVLLYHPAPLPEVPNYLVVLGVFFFFFKSTMGQDWRQYHTVTKSEREEICFPSDFTPFAVSFSEVKKQRNIIVLLSFIACNTFFIDCLT